MLDLLTTILVGVVVIGFLVFIHEGGHYLVARAFGVRVTEFMLGLPGPRVGFTRGETRFGVTAIPLGGYAKVCGMEPGAASPHLKGAMQSMVARRTANMEDVALDLGCSDDDACFALDELVEWGTLTGPTKKDLYNTYRLAPYVPTDLPIDELFARESKRQYRSLPAWKRILILLAGPAMNLLFALLVIVLCYSVVGVDVQRLDGTVTHVVLSVWQSLQMGLMYTWSVIQAVVQLFNPATVGEVVSESTSIIGIAVVSKEAFDAGIMTLLEFSAMISVSLGIMNMLPIPPLDGGRILVEIVQKIVGREISLRALNAITLVGVGLFMLLFVVMMGQDISRFVFGNW